MTTTCFLILYTFKNFFSIIFIWKSPLAFNLHCCYAPSVCMCMQHQKKRLSTSLLPSLTIWVTEISRETLCTVRSQLQLSSINGWAVRHRTSLETLSVLCRNCSCFSVLPDQVSFFPGLLPTTFCLLAMSVSFCFSIFPSWILMGE